MAVVNQYVDNVLVGTITVPDPAPIVMSWREFNDYLVGLLGGNDAARAALQVILEGARDKSGTTDTDKLTRYFYTWFVGETAFTKDAVIARLAPVATTVISSAQKTAVANNWPVK